MAMIVLGLIGATGAVHEAYERGLTEGSSHSKAELKTQFELGQKAGVEYEQWFCENPQYDLSGASGSGR